MRWLIFLLLLVAGMDADGQAKIYPFSKLDIQDGLSNNGITTIFKDRRGYIWIGTSLGLNRYDGYSFRVFRHEDSDSNSLTDDNVQRIFQGPGDKLYISGATGGVDVYDPLTERFMPGTDGFFRAHGLSRSGIVGIITGKDNDYYFVYQDSGVYRFDPGKAAIRLGPQRSGPAASPVVDAALDSSGGLWLSHEDGALQRMDLSNGRITQRIGTLQLTKPRAQFGYKIFIDPLDKIWLYAPGNLTGLWEFDRHTGALAHFCRDSGQARLSSNTVGGVITDDDGLVWIATDQGGLDLLDRKELTVRCLQHSDEERSLPENTVTTLYRDNAGIVWAGTFKSGIAYYQQNLLRFPLYRRQPGVPGSLPYDDINCFAEDPAGNIWIGTNGGGLIYYDRSKDGFHRFRHEPTNPNSLCNDVVVTLAVDHKGRLWIGTYHGGLDCYDGRRFIHYRHKDSDPASLADDRVYAIHEDSDRALWIGTMTGGLDRLDVEKGKFYHNTTATPYSIHSDYISSLAEDSASNLWIGTGWGIEVLSRSTGKYTHYTTANGLSDNVIFGITRDHLGNMWVATRKGLNVLQPGRDTFQVFQRKDGLPSNSVIDVLEDGDHHLWAGTSGGLSRITVSQEAGRILIDCVNFDEYDGLQGREFNHNAALRTREGEMIFGGGKGFNLFSPGSIGIDRHIPPVVLTGLQLYNKAVPLPASVLMDSNLVLSYNENNFTLEFAALSYINPRKNRYAYQLSGFDKDWMTTDGRNPRATYTNIDPGDYVFRVRASNSDGVWNNKGVVIRVIVRPPFWKTPLAYAVYILLIAAALYLGRLQIIRRAKARFALAEERREAVRIHELDRMKIKFFTNLSHEFRTPLSLILSPVDKLIHSAEDPGRRQLAMTIDRNAKRLLHLVNQLLDLRKMEVNELKLNMSRGDIAEFIQATTLSFADLAEGKGIALDYRSDTDHLPTLFDRDKVERIVFNLLSNAFKFTSTGGRVQVDLAIAENDEHSALLQLRVTDTGIGIPTELQEKIFESFFQGDTPGHIRNQGTGIGLAITREFVELHGGTIRVESSQDKGSCFTVLLPVSLLPGAAVTATTDPAISPATNPPGLTANPSASAAHPTQPPVSPPEGNPPVPAANPSTHGPAGKPGESTFKLLLVEDDDDFRFYLKENLSPLFTVLEAANGREGWQKTLSAQPDLVVSDVNMPLMDGLTLCAKIKNDQRVRHIPVILLTALSAEEAQLRALGMGVNDYISKPFNVEILISRIRNLLDLKGSIEQTLKKRVDIQPAGVEPEPERTEADFIREAVEVLEKNMANADFSVEDWSRELGLSRTTLYKRILTVTGKTPIGFIRHFRMQRAAQLLEKTRHNVAEVAYMVGFNNPKYFARYFKEVYGKLPSIYQAEKRKS